MKDTNSNSREPGKQASDSGQGVGAQTPSEGLSASEAAQRLKRYGPNELAEEKVSLVRKLAGYFWGPIPWMIEAAALLSALVREWADLTIILVLLVFNAGVGFWQEYQAGNAIEQLKKRLALKARVRRDGKWQSIAARELVPGDLIRLRLGDIVPADARLITGTFLSVDQSALTGESLPVEKREGETVYSGSSVRQGEMTAQVTGTGMHTYFGRTAELAGSAGSVSHFQKAVLTIGDYLIYLTLGLVAVLILVGLHRQQPVLELLQFALILTVAAIPVALPAVLSVTMAIGALALSRMKAIVSRLESIEEMAGIDVLCSDKTGTLTENRLTAGEPYLAEGVKKDELLLSAALACPEDSPDAIDKAVQEAYADKNRLQQYKQTAYVPFDPVSKRSEATLEGPGGQQLRTTKGAPQVIIAMSLPAGQEREKAKAQVEALAAKGYRTLGVARFTDGQWHFLGLLPLFDPPRADAEETLRDAAHHGIDVKMVTGDNLAIGRQVARQLNLRANILSADRVFSEQSNTPEQEREAAARIEQADGFAEVFPEHKYRIVRALQSRGHLVGMTGDGVNDAPALRQADVGVAVSGATDAARAAAAVVLTAPGLAVLVRAVEEARRIFERMNAYAIYRITETIRIMIFLVAAMLVYDFYPVTAVMIILLALLNDLPIMTIAYDNTWLDPKPVRWQMRRVLTLATVLGGIGVFETFGLLAVAKSWLHIGEAQLQSLLFLKLVVAGHLTLFVARSRRPFWARPHPAPILLMAVLGTQTVAALIVGFGWFVTAIPWSWVGIVWLYCLAWILIEDRAKVLLYRHLQWETPRHQKFIQTASGGRGGPAR
jgi:H+-transporting ATPase